MLYVQLIAALAILQFTCFGAMTGNARRLSGLKAPAMVGDDRFERMYRVQMNTLENLVAFLPALLLAANFFPALLVSGLGLIYLVGRVIYWKSYTTEPSTRGLGFMLSMIPTIVLIVLAVVGPIISLLSSN